MAVQLAKRLFTVGEYERLIDAAILAEDDRVELVNGEIVQMSPVGSAHAACVKRLNHLFSQRVGQQALIGVQDPVRLDAQSEPQPDLTLLKPRADYYAQGHPTPRDIYLVVEVAETSLAYDQEVKAPICARAGVAEVWLVNLAEGCVDSCRQPTAQGYRLRRRFAPGEAIEVQALPEVSLPVGEIVGR